MDEKNTEPVVPYNSGQRSALAFAYALDVGRKTMKTHSVIFAVLCMTTICLADDDKPTDPSPSVPEGQSDWLMAFSIEEIEKRYEDESKLCFGYFEHEIWLPEKKEWKKLKRKMKDGDQIWAFDGLDSGWALIREGKIVLSFITNHETDANQSVEATPANAAVASP